MILSNLFLLDLIHRVITLIMQYVLDEYSVNDLQKLYICSGFIFIYILKLPKM